MGMGPDIHALPRQEFGWPHLIPKNERTDHASLGRWQGPPDFEIPDIPGTRHNHRFDGTTEIAIARDRVFASLPAH